MAVEFVATYQSYDKYNLVFFFFVTTLNGLYWVSIVVTGLSIKREATLARRDGTGYEWGIQIKDNCSWKLHYGNHR